MEYYWITIWLFISYQQHHGDIVKTSWQHLTGFIVSTFAVEKYEVTKNQDFLSGLILEDYLDFCNKVKMLVLKYKGKDE